MTVVVEYKIRDENTTMDEWLDVWSVRGDDARDDEPETSAYAACVNVQEPDKVMIFERYEHGIESIKLHGERTAHATLMETMGKARMTKYQALPGVMFYDIPGYGWWSRPTQRKDAHTGVVLGRQSNQWDIKGTLTEKQ